MSTCVTVGVTPWVLSHFRSRTSRTKIFVIHKGLTDGTFTGPCKIFFVTSFGSFLGTLKFVRDPFEEHPP